MFVHKIFPCLILATLISCGQNSQNSEKINSDINSETDSINAVRAKYNDSINILNATNRFRDLTGKHQLTHSSISKSGTINFKNIGRDLYNVSGSASSGNDYVKIDGEIKMVSDKYLNFTGKVTQSLQENDNGKIDVRAKKTSFVRNGKEGFWRFQNRVNSSGFADNIDIYLAN